MLPPIWFENISNTMSCGASIDGNGPEIELLEMSNSVIFLGNCGIVPVSWFELRLSTRKAMSLKCAGKVPLNLLLLEMSIFVARKIVCQNQSGILSIIALLERSSSIISNCCRSQSGNRGPIWQDAKCAFRSLKGGNQSAFNLQIIGSHV